MSIRFARRGLAGLAVAVAIATLSAAGQAGAAGSKFFNVQNLISDSSAVSAAATDGSLVNGWGLSAGPTTPWWVANNGTSTSTLYSGVGSKSPLTVTVPGSPTGTVFNANTADFSITQGGTTAASRFLFATEGGSILGWAPTVAPTTAIAGVDNSAKGAIYKGLATLNDRLYATDFHNARVDVYDASWNPVALPNGFSDPQIPKGWAPFGIQALGGNIFVTYAQQDKAAKDEVAGGGLGYVDEYSPDGVLLARVAKQGKPNAPLNAPWGLAMAPPSFGVFGGDLLVGNFGSGRISAYLEKTPGHWVYKGQLAHADGSLVVIDGLWAIAFGNDSAGGPSSSLYFAAGPTGETHGLFGAITVG